MNNYSKPLFGFTIILRKKFDLTLIGIFVYICKFTIFFQTRYC